MRGGVAALATPHSLGETLPGIYRDEDFLQRFCAGLDEVLAPVLLTLDSMSAYIDPGTAPQDVLEWLAGWVGIALDGRHDTERRRAVVRSAFALHGVRGTAEGVRQAVALVFDGVPEVRDSGGTAWSVAAGGSLPGSDRQAMHVRLRVADRHSVDLQHLDAVVAAVKPAHVLHRVEVVDAVSD